MAQLNFDARQVAPDTGIETVPAGWYNVMVDESDMKPTKQGDGSYLQVRFNILDGQYAGRKLFARFNIRNPSPVAQEIGQKQLSALAHAVGHLVIGQSEELHGKPLKVKVKIRTDKSGEYEPQNEITSYKNINEQVDAAVAGAPAAFAPPAGAPQAPTAPTAFTPPVAAPAPVAAPPVAAPVAAPHDPIAAARADGWVPHPTAPGYHYKGQEALPDAQVAAKYPAPAAVAPPAWTPPAAQQPWNNAAPAAAATPPAAPVAAPNGAPPVGGTPPWAQAK